MLKTQCLLLIFLASLFAIKIISCAPSTAPTFVDDGIRNNLAVGSFTYESPHESVTRDFAVQIPDPSAERRFYGKTASSSPKKPDVVAIMRFEYHFSDSFSIASGQTENIVEERTIASNRQQMNLAITRTMVREFPIRRDEKGFFHGAFSHDGRSRIDHRFTNSDFRNLSSEAIEYFLSIIPNAAHDQRQTLLEYNMISMEANAG